MRIKFQGATNVEDENAGGYLSNGTEMNTETNQSQLQRKTLSPIDSGAGSSATPPSNTRFSKPLPPIETTPKRIERNETFRPTDVPILKQAPTQYISEHDAMHKTTTSGNEIPEEISTRKKKKKQKKTKVENYAPQPTEANTIEISAETLDKYKNELGACLVDSDKKHKKKKKKKKEIRSEPTGHEKGDE